MKRMRVIKQDYSGQNVWEYSGTLLHRNGNQITIEAFFDRRDTLIDEVVLREGDKFVEMYFLDKWFNVYEISDRNSGITKAWYCNISYPAEITGNTITYRDLELDLLVYPGGSQVVLDMDEFEGLPLDKQNRSNALEALSYLQLVFSSGENPFSSK